MPPCVSLSRVLVWGNARVPKPGTQEILDDMFPILGGGQGGAGGLHGVFDFAATGDRGQPRTFIRVMLQQLFFRN